MFTRQLTIRSAALRNFHSTSRALIRPPPLTRVGPPQLPRADQEEFEALVRAAESGQSGSVDAESMKSALKASATAPSATMGKEEIKAELQQHPDLRKQAPAQFEGEVNPFTGEVGGPKRDPFVAGDGDWQYSGRVTVSLACGWQRGGY
ncbi:hypothetical protein QFC20_003559 [Naganishia adeliensis]|uniref:Uncharacterized protein n=1 Tax=Naganishia adeliensis TaxID=92952 RepID=A0ACC2WAV6_9TREE|nr:hypothetical protein QFC20_003559 [Naganishia adeliensis]